jgi:hypothetical protein
MPCLTVAKGKPAPTWMVAEFAAWILSKVQSMPRINLEVV